MNYYKRGDAANADKIKAAFEAKGINVKDWEFFNPLDLYFNVGKEIYTIDYDIKHIVVGRADYEELELPVEPQAKFKVGDLVVYRDMLGRIDMVKKKEDGYVYRVGNCLAWEDHIRLADHRDEVRILRSPGVC